MRSLPVCVALLALSARAFGSPWVGQRSVNAAYGQQPSIALGPSGAPWVVWHGYMGDSSLLFARWIGDRWAGERGVGPDAPGLLCRLRPSLAFDDLGVACLAWDNADSNETDNIGSSFWADTCWTPEVQVNLPGAAARNFAPKVACGGGSVWCVWYGGPTDMSPYSVYAGRWDSVAQGWQPETQVSPPNGNNHWWCDVAVDSLGTPHVVWTETEHAAIYCSYYDGSQWSSPLLVNDSSNVRAASWAAPRIVIDRDGVLHVSYTGLLIGSSRRDVFYTRNDGTGWMPSVRVTQDTLYDCHEWYSDIAADLSNNVWIVFDRQGEGSDQFRVYAIHFDGQSWSAEQRLDNDSASHDGGPEVCLDGSAEPWVVWTGTTGQSHLSIYYNCQDAAGMCESTSGELVPFHCATLVRAGPVRIAYHLDARLRVHLAVYDMLGRLVETLVSKAESEGEHSVWWQARVPNGPYFCCLHAGEVTETSKIVMTGR